MDQVTLAKNQIRADVSVKSPTLDKCHFLEYLKKMTFIQGEGFDAYSITRILKESS